MADQDAPRMAEPAYEALLAEALARVPVHNPEWTNLSDADPGVTILQLFARMTERLVERANRVPEESRSSFLRLFGRMPRAAVPARGLITFTNTKGPTRAISVPAGLALWAGRLPWRTGAGLDVLPVEGHACWKAPAGQAEPREPGADGPAVFYRTVSLNPPAHGRPLSGVDLVNDTVDGCLWLALLQRPRDDPEETRQAIAERDLALGVFPVAAAGGPVAAVTLSPSAGPSQNRVPLVADVATGARDAAGQPVYQPLVVSGTDVLREPGVLTLRLPAASAIGNWRFARPDERGVGDLPPMLSDTRIEARVLTWVRLRLASRQAGLGAALGWVGVHAALVSQHSWVDGETIGRGTGEAGQSYMLTQRDALPASLTVRVDDQLWPAIDDLLAAGPETPPLASTVTVAPAPSRVCQFDPAGATVRFGDGIRGARPPAGAEVRASYAYGGGRRGNLDAGVIQPGAGLAPELRVTNPLPTYGGLDAETPAEAEAAAASHLRHRDRAVTLEDFRDLARQTPGVELARVEVLPGFHPELPDLPIPGSVTLLLVPPEPAGGGPPLAHRNLCAQVAEWLDVRRLITTEVIVRGPEFVPLQVAVGIEPVATRPFSEVRQAVQDAFTGFLSPVRGGPDGRGWPLQRPVAARDLFGLASRVDGVAYVTGITLGDAGGHPVQSVQLTGLQLPWLHTVHARHGAPGDPGPAAPPPVASPTLRPLLVPAPTPSSGDPGTGQGVQHGSAPGAVR